MDWQIIVVLIIVAACALYLGRTWYRTWSGKASACGGCPSCEGDAPSGSNTRQS
jgi:attachment p12 family protein